MLLRVCFAFLGLHVFSEIEIELVFSVFVIRYFLRCLLLLHLVELFTIITSIKNRNTIPITNIKSNTNMPHHIKALKFITSMPFQFT
ncbi:hypothetical protein Bhyg_15609 [Pseudolycoriella hygida]|uniref:Uncharacterized protein n=1 Tax=Pseudolycoriella hygida TaxID=35572 RepID=A0A9Q0MM60_9DIPT|nr:hypothetical protein Bhyg_15609 [Pseudolycoriella hygida]